MKNDHPVFGDADPNAWVDIEQIDSCGDPKLTVLIKTEREEIVSSATKVLISFLDKSIEEFKHQPELSDFLVRFLKNDHNTFQVYLEFTFTSHLNQNRPESDSWWVIIACPKPMSLKKYNVCNFGWYCQ